VEFFLAACGVCACGEVLGDLGECSFSIAAGEYEISQEEEEGRQRHEPVQCCTCCT